MVNDNISLAQKEWSKYEENPDFFRNELLIFNGNVIEDSTKQLLKGRVLDINQLFNNEKFINDFFIKLYNVDSEVLQSSNKISLYGMYRLNNNLSIDDIKSEGFEDVVKDYIHYSAGNFFGRYSLHKEGLFLANREKLWKNI